MRGERARVSERPLVILGGGSGFWELSELVADINRAEPRFRIVGVLDDAVDLWGTDLAGVPVSGPLEKAREYPSVVRFVFGIGTYRTRMLRRPLLERVGLPDERYETLVHPTAKVFSTASVGPGCIVHYGTVVFNHSRLDPFVIVSASCVIATHNLIGRGALLGSGVITGYLAAIGCYAHVGQGVLVGERCEVGAGAQIGMGSVVLQSVKPGAFAIGSPLRFIDKVEVPPEVSADWELSRAAAGRA
jgi:serine acetyltransferase